MSHSASAGKSPPPADGHGVRVLLVDDDEAVREVGAYNLGAAGYAVDTAANGAAALARFDAEAHGLVITDLRMPGISGVELLAQLKRRAPDVPVIVVTAHGSVEAAVAAMRAGAYDFVEKPFGRDLLLHAVQRALERRELALENRALRRRAAGVEREIIAESPAMQQLLRAVDRAAASDASVLLGGESGTGKELLARRIHARSARADGPFVPVNCAAMAAELLESELFGHEKGAYTGATTSRRGRFRSADGGTIFLDEVAEIPLPLQSKLLRALQEKVVDVVGADSGVTVDVRVVAATNSALPERVAAGAFRSDLYYRLNVVGLEVPPLRERTEDIEPLARHFIARAAGGRDLVIPDEVLDALRRRSWPGNVRELENACERMVVLCEGGTLRVADLPPAAPPQPGQAAGAALELDGWPPLPPDGLSLVDLERRVIERALALKDGNVTQAAQYLRVPRHVLAYRIEKYGIRRA